MASVPSEMTPGVVPWDFKETEEQLQQNGIRKGENRGTIQHVSSMAHENSSHCNWPSEIPVPENENLPSGRNSAAGGKINKNHLEIPVEPWMLELNLSLHAHKRTQDSKQGIF